jgi:hypothetical protein
MQGTYLKTSTIAQECNVSEPSTLAFLYDHLGM